MSKRIRAEALISQGKQCIQEVALNFGMEFAKNPGFIGSRDAIYVKRSP